MPMSKLSLPSYFHTRWPRCNFCRLCNYFGPRDDSSEYFQYFQSFQWPYEIIKIGVLAKRVGLQHMATWWQQQPYLALLEDASPWISMNLWPLWLRKWIGASDDIFRAGLVVVWWWFQMMFSQGDPQIQPETVWGTLRNHQTLCQNQSWLVSQPIPSICGLYLACHSSKGSKKKSVVLNPLKPKPQGLWWPWDPVSQLRRAPGSCLYGWPVPGWGWPWTALCELHGPGLCGWHKTSDGWWVFLLKGCAPKWSVLLGKMMVRLVRSGVGVVDELLEIFCWSEFGAGRPVDSWSQVEEETALNEVCCDLRRFHEQLRDHSDLIAAGVCLSNRGLLAWKSDIRRAIYFFFRGRFCFFLAPGSMLSCISDFLLLSFFASLLTLLLCLHCFSAYIAALLFLLLCFSAFCFPCFSAFLLFCFSCFLAFLLLCFPCFSAFVLLCLSTSTILLFLYPGMCFCCSTSCSFASLLPVFTVSLFRETLGETQRHPKEILIRNPTWSPNWTLKKP